MPETNSRSALVAKNAIFSVLSWMLPLGLSLIVTPIIVSGLGTASFGIYALALGFIGYSFTFGIGKAAGKYVAQFKAAGDTKAISEAVTAVLAASAILGVVAAIVFWLFSRTLVVELLALPDDQVEAATRSLQLAGMVILFTMISLVYQNVLQGIQRFDRLLLISNISAVSMNAGAAVIAFNGGTVEALLLWNLITVASIAIVFFLTAKALLPELRFDLSIRNQIRRKVFFYSGSIILYQVAGNLLFIFERSLIVREFGTSVLTFYAIPLSLAVHFLGFAAGISLAVFPAANSLLGDKDKSLVLYKVSTKLLVGASSFFCLGRSCLARNF
ncbi:MAG: oligosaccharide flippase family protein [Acidobacteriota bacterium]|nr:MAG: oligosaccharide flippase family protein [Acidobacteriota bacterium]